MTAPHDHDHDHENAPDAMMAMPSLGLTARLVLALIVMAVAVVALDTTLSRWAFQTRFLSYVNEQEAQALEQLADRLGAFHAEFGDWEQLRDRRDLARLLRDSAREHAEPDQGALPGQRLRRTRVMLSRLHIADAAGDIMIGSMQELAAKGLHRAEIHANGRHVGTVMMSPQQHLARESDLRFSREHTQTLWLIAGLAVLLASAVGYALARHMLAPVRAVARGARDLAEGRYETRLGVSRRDELGGLARDFNVLAAGLEASRESRRRWLADVAHELRTPLTVLRAEIEALRDGVRTVDDASMAALAGEAERLGHLVDDLHHLSLADAGALAYRSVRLDAASLVGAAVDRFRPRLAQAALAIELHVPDAATEIFGDPDRLDQLLANLLENALRYTDAPGLVRVTLSAARDWIEISVEDGPPGVPAEEIPRLFERFARRDAARNRSDGGSGLGLAIARRLVEAHGGTLTGAPSALGGLCMRVRLPADGPVAKT